MGNGAARSVMRASPSRNATRIARRTGSASAPYVASSRESSTTLLTLQSPPLYSTLLLNIADRGTSPMPIFQTAHAVIGPEGVNAVNGAIAEFVGYVADNEPGSPLYAAWQQADDPTRFVHLFIFDDEAAHATHGASAAVRKFESVYQPYLAEGPV